MPKLNYPDMSAELDQAIWTFNFRPDTYIHSSWLAAMPDGMVMPKLFSHSRGQGPLVLHLMQQLGVYDSVFFDFGKPLSRLALWPGAELEKLVLYLGAVFELKTLRLLVRRDDILKVQQVVGDELFAFMQQRAAQITHNVPDTVILPVSLSVHKRLLLRGMLCLRAAFAHYPEAFWQRLLYKLERAWASEWQQYKQLGQAWDAQASECAVLLQKVAIEIRMGVNRDGKILLN